VFLALAGLVGVIAGILILISPLSGALALTLMLAFTRWLRASCC
jgi:uncharacterized membrane protein HdeD (DUF308 family)